MSFSDFGTIETKRIQVDEGIIAQRFGTEIRDRNLEFFAGDASHPNQRISFNVHDGSVYTSVLTLDGNGFTIDKLVTQGGDSGLEAKDGSNIMGRMQISHFTSNANPYAGRMSIALNNGLDEVDVHEAFGITPTAATFSIPQVVIRDSVSVGGSASVSVLRVHTSDVHETEIAMFSHVSSSDSVRIVQSSESDSLEIIVGTVRTDEVAAGVVISSAVRAATASITSLAVGHQLGFAGGWILQTEGDERDRTNILFLNETGGAGVLSIGGGGLCTPSLRVASSLHSTGEAVLDGGVIISGLMASDNAVSTSSSTLLRARNGPAALGDEHKAVRIVDIDCGSSTALHAPITVTGAVHAMDSAAPVHIVTPSGILFDDGTSSLHFVTTEDGSLHVANTLTGGEVMTVGPAAFSMSSGAVRFDGDGLLRVCGGVQVSMDVSIGGGIVGARVLHVETGYISTLKCDVASVGGVCVGGDGVVFASTGYHITSSSESSPGIAMCDSKTGETSSVMAHFDSSRIAFARTVTASDDLLIARDLSVGGRICAGSVVGAAEVAAPILSGVTRVACADGGLIIGRDTGKYDDPVLLHVDDAGDVHISGSIVVLGDSVRLGDGGLRLSAERSLEGEALAGLNVPLHISETVMIGDVAAVHARLTPEGITFHDSCGFEAWGVGGGARGEPAAGVTITTPGGGVFVDGSGTVHATSVHAESAILLGRARVEHASHTDTLTTESRLALSASEDLLSEHAGRARLYVRAEATDETALRLESAGAASGTYIDIDARGGFSLSGATPSGLCFTSDGSVNILCDAKRGGPSLHLSKDLGGVAVSDGSLSVSELVGVRSVRAADTSYLELEASVVIIAAGSLQCAGDIVAPSLCAGSRLLVGTDTVLTSDAVHAPEVHAQYVFTEVVSTSRIAGVSDDVILVASGEVRVSSSMLWVDGDAHIAGTDLAVPPNLRLASASSGCLTLSSSAEVSLALDSETSEVRCSVDFVSPVVVCTDTLVCSSLRSVDGASSSITLHAHEVMIGSTADNAVRIGDGRISTSGEQIQIGAVQRVVLCDGGVCIDAASGKCRIGGGTTSSDHDVVSSRLHVVSEPLDASALLLEARNTSCVLRMTTLEEGYGAAIELGDAWSIASSSRGDAGCSLDIVASSSRGGANPDLSFSSLGLATFRVPVALDLGISVGGDAHILGALVVDTNVSASGDLRCGGGIVVVGSWPSSQTDAFIIDTVSGASTETVTLTSSAEGGGTLHIAFPTVSFPGALTLSPNAVRTAVDLVVGGHLIREVAAPVAGTDAVNLATLERALADLYSSENVFPAPVYFVPSSNIGLRAFGIGFDISATGGSSLGILDFLVGSSSHGGLSFRRFGDAAPILNIRPSDLCVEMLGDVRTAGALRLGAPSHKNVITSSAEGFLSLNDVLLITNSSPASSDVRVTTRLGISSSTILAPAYRLHVRDTNDDIAWLTTSSTRGRMVVETTSTSTSSQAMTTFRDSKSGVLFSSGYASLSDAYVVASSTDLVSNTHLVLYRTRNEAVLAGDLRLRRKDGGIAALRIEDSTTSATLARFEPSGIQLRNSAIREVIDTASGDVHVVHSLGGVTRVDVHKDGVTITGALKAASMSIGENASFSPTGDGTALKLDAVLEATAGLRSGFLTTREFLGFNVYEDASGNYRHTHNGEAMMLALKSDGDGNPVADVTFSALPNKNGSGELVIAEGTPAMRLSQRGLGVGTHDVSDSVLHVSGDLSPQLKISNPNMGDGNGVSCVLGCTETGALSIKSDENRVLFGEADVECGALRASNHVYIGLWRVGVDATTGSLSFEMVNPVTGAYDVKHTFSS